MSTIKKDSARKHLTFEDRIEIQDCLFHGVSFKGIGKRIGKDPTTISNEVKKHICHLFPAFRCSSQYLLHSRPQGCDLHGRSPFILLKSAVFIKVQLFIISDH